MVKTLKRINMDYELANIVIKLEKEKEELTEMLKEIESQLKDSGGFDILRTSIKDLIESQL